MQSPSAEEYRVRLDLFEGPLDLLLYLIRRAEVDITDIPISTVTDQYIKYIRDIERIDIERAGEFLVMAATLMEIKSRMLTPEVIPLTESPADIAEPGTRNETDPRQDLVRQLLEYKKYRDAADALDDRRFEWQKRYPAAKAGVDNEQLREALAESGDLDLEDLELIDLVNAFAKISETVNFDSLGEHKITFDDTPIEVHAVDIVNRLRHEGTDVELGLVDLFEGRSRGEMIGVFLAILELVRQRRIGVRQQGAAGTITVRLKEPEAQESTNDDGGAVA